MNRSRTSYTESFNSFGSFSASTKSLTSAGSTIRVYQTSPVPSQPELSTSFLTIY